MKQNRNFITLRGNGVQYGPFPKKQLKFLQKAQKINEDEHRSFCVGDFHEMTPENFRQYIYKLHNYIEIEVPGYPKFYKIKGINLTAYNFKPITGKNIGDTMLPILEKLDDQSVSLNDLKIKFDSSNGLYNVLVNLGAKPDEITKDIVWDDLRIDEDNVKLTIRIDSKNVNIRINCKNRPIVYDMNGILKITEVLGIISEFISNEAKHIVKIPSVGDWICVAYKLGANGQYDYDKMKFHRSWKDIAGGFLRRYAEQSRKQKFNMSIDTRILL